MMAVALWRAWCGVRGVERACGSYGVAVVAVVAAMAVMSAAWWWATLDLYGPPLL